MKLQKKFLIFVISSLLLFSLSIASAEYFIISKTERGKSTPSEKMNTARPAKP